MFYVVLFVTGLVMVKCRFFVIHPIIFQL